jgi:N-acetylneuraminate synthase/sialic acid synthase
MYESPYDNENSFGATYGAHREALEFGRDQYVELKRYSTEIGITFFATAFDVESADFLATLDVPAYKIASGDLNNVPLLAHVARFGKPMIVSTGGGSIEDVQRAHDTVTAINPQLGLLQCTASYPSEPADMNLRVITAFRERYPNTVIGLSDHQNGIAMADIAYILGARVIEKHFTLNRASKGTDHAYSLEPEGMRKLVRDLRRVRVALGSGLKTPLAVEKKPLFKMGKKLVAARCLKVGHVLSAADVAIKSPNDGLPPYALPSVLGHALRRDLAEDDSIAFEDLL